MIQAVTDIRAIRDTVIAENMTMTQGLSRERAMAVTKLDEAALWLIEAHTREGRILIVDKHEYRELLDSHAERHNG